MERKMVSMMKNDLLIVSLQKYGAGPADSLGLSEALCRRGYFHNIIVSAGNELLERWKDNEYRRVYFLPTFQSRFINFLVATLLLIRPANLFFLVFRQKQKIIHITHFHPWIFFVLLAARLRRAKFIYTLHDNPFKPKEAGLSILATHLEKFFASKADAVVTHSNFIKDAVMKFFKNKTFYVMPLGAYTHLCNFNPRHTPAGKINFLFFGRIEPFKGLDILVKAYEILRERVPEASLTIAGKGEIPAELRQKINRLGIQLMERWIGPEEMCSIMQEADVVVLPYRNATQSGVISLAMACGVTVIASKVGGLVEQVIDGKTGFLVTPGDPMDLAEKMEILAKDRKLLETFKMNQRRFAETSFSWDASAEIFINIVKNLA
jgi:glycosyltransferase involved in cell wall biosynthesis